MAKKIASNIQVKKLRKQNTDSPCKNIPCQISLTFLLKNKRFKKDCNKTLELANKVDSYLKGRSIPSIIPIVNSMCINLKLPQEIKKLNSCLIISPRGSGKTVFLEDILAKSNPEHFVILPPKIFESELVEKEKEYFHNKILIQSDLIVTFEGLSKKQRQQLTNFFTKLLEGNYARDKKGMSNVRTMVLFGLASEKLDRFGSSLLSETFFDRVPPYLNEVTEEDKKKILEFRSKNNSFGKRKARTPTINLPLPEKIEDEKKVEIMFPHNEEIEKRIIDLALELDWYGVQSSVRSQNYIKIFMMCNALLNGRKEVTVSDLELYELVHPLFISSMPDLDIEKRICWLLKKYPNLSDKELIRKSGASKPTFYKYKDILSRKDLL